jgi:Na+/H+ antiporter NhaC
MELADYTQSAISVLPPLVAIVLAIITHRVLLSIGVAIVLGALLLTSFQPLATLAYLGQIFASLFYWEDGLNGWNIALITFLLLLGVLTAVITRLGGTKAFGEWALTHIHTQRRARLFTVVAGLLIFIDDYFNSLTVGQIARPITDANKIPRAKLAYLIDSTAAPICLLSPFSSWGAYVMGILAVIMTQHGMASSSPLTEFVSIIQFNFYPFISLLFVFAVAYSGWVIGPMKEHQMRASLGQLFSHSKGPVPGEISKMKVGENGHIRDLILPLVILIATCVLAIFALGYYHVLRESLPVSILEIMKNTDIAIALVIGAATGLGAALLLSLFDSFQTNDYVQSVKIGCKAMAPAIYILIFAWMIIEITDSMGTGEYLALYINDALPIALLPALAFLLAGLMAFSTGSSWGTFGIMLPIAANIAIAIEPSLMTVMLAAVLSGALFGDHCSPISDTSILASTGAGCHLMDHVITQIPYCLIKAGIALLGFLLYGFTESFWISVNVMLLIYIALLIFMRKEQDYSTSNP